MTKTLPLLNRLRSRLHPAGRPPVAVEIAPGGVLAAAGTVSSEIKYAFRPLPEGAVIPNATQPNLRSPGVIASAVRSALEEVSGTMRFVTVLVPDPAVRVFALDFDSLPDAPADVLAVLRLRLKRVVPFDVEAAKISYQPLSQVDSSCKVLAVVIPGSVLNEYEAVVRDAGYHAGAVLPSALSALAALTPDEPILSAYLSSFSLTTSITAKNNILLYRTHELPQDADEKSAEIQRDIAVAVAYFEDQLRGSPPCVYYAGNIEAEEFGRSALTQKMPVRGYSSAPHTDCKELPESSNPAGLLGALAGARCA